MRKPKYYKVKDLVGLGARPTSSKYCYPQCYSEIKKKKTIGYAQIPPSRLKFQR